MNSKIFSFLFLTIIIVSCREQQRTVNEKITKTDTIKVAPQSSKKIDSVPADKVPYLHHKMTTEELLSLFLRLRVEVEKKLKTALGTQANDLYDAYFEKNQAIIAKLIESETGTLEQFYNEDDRSQSLVKQTGQLLSKYDLVFDEIGEGIVEIKTRHDFYYNIFKNYVTDDYKAYLAIKKEEDKVGYSVDAALSISFEAIGERIIVWEALMAKYPESRLLDKMKDIYRSYQTDYLFGLDNTATRERPVNGKVYINPENIAEFNRFINQHPKSPTVRLIKIFMKNFERDDVRNLIEAEQKKYN